MTMGDKGQIGAERENNACNVEMLVNIRLLGFSAHVWMVGDCIGLRLLLGSSD